MRKIIEKWCPVCQKVFLADSKVGDRRPVIACDNGDSICADCFSKQKEEHNEKCPICEGDMQKKLTVNKMLLETLRNVMDRFPEIAVDEMEVGMDPFAEGEYAKVYDAKWRDRNVAVKVVVSHAAIDKCIREVKYEANLAIGLLHPNIIRLFGTTRIQDEYLGIVMEKAEHGSLRDWIGKMDQEQISKTALGIINGLTYVHSEDVVHSDLKPQNVLMFGSKDDMIPKIADFGVSKVIRSVTMHTTAGTPLYMAPEMRSLSPYGSSADIFSLAMMLFEMFSGQPSSQLTQHMFAIASGKTNKISDSFPVPSNLVSIIERGLDKNPEERPSLSEYKGELMTVVKEPTTGAQEIKEKTITTKQQVAEMANINVAIPAQEMSWNASCEVLNSKQLRSEMIDDIKSKSHMASLINDSVFSAMKVVPRHLFIEVERLERGSQTSQQEMVNAAYLYQKPIPATMKSNESSPEIIGTQLSMTEIIQGQSVLLVGIKGGYIQSLIAQLVGINGSVVTVTADEASMNVCRDKVNRDCPWKSNIDWIKVSNIKDRGGIVAEVKRQNQNQLYHTIIYCGAVDEFPVEMKELLHDGGNVSIMAPVKEDEGMRFKLYLRHGNDAELRTVTDFGVIFEDAH